MNYRERGIHWREKNVGAKLFLNELNWILKAKRSTIAGIDEVKEKIRVWDDTEDHSKEWTVTKWICRIKEIQKRDQEIILIV